MQIKYPIMCYFGVNLNTFNKIITCVPHSDHPCHKAHLTTLCQLLSKENE